MKACLLILFATASLHVFPQDTLDLPLKRAVKTTKNNCRHATAADVCKVSIYETHQPDLFYKINYDFLERVHSKGAVVKEEIKTGGQKKQTEYFEVGIWRYYNYEANEIIYYRCVYSGNPGCSVLTKDELKKERIQ